MFTVTTGVCVCVFGFYMLSSSNVTVPRPSYLLVSEHLIASSLFGASIPGACQLSHTGNINTRSLFCNVCLFVCLSQIPEDVKILHF